MRRLFRVPCLISLITSLLLCPACQPDDAAEAIPTLQEQLVGTWELGSLDAELSVDGEHLTVYLAQMAETYGLSAEEVALALLLIQGQTIQQLIGNEPSLTLLADQHFELLSRGEAPVAGRWQLSDDEQQLHLLPPSDSTLIFSIQAFQEDALTLLLDETFATNLSLPGVPEFLRARLTMDWERAGGNE
ncbi:MAG: hypothetical protein RIG62_10120 [Cyclobacteriaceae bacterium]